MNNQITGWRSPGGNAFLTQGPDKTWYWVNEDTGWRISFLKNRKVIDMDLHNSKARRQYDKLHGQELYKLPVIKSLEEFDKVFGTDLDIFYQEENRKVKEGSKKKAEKIYKFKDGNFKFYTALYGSWFDDRRIIFRVREDTTPEKRAEEKGIKYYDKIVFSTEWEIKQWLDSHKDFEVIGKKAEKEITPEMIEFFEKRTNEHIDRVKDNLLVLADNGFIDKDEAEERGNKHDSSKFNESNLDGYVWLTWWYANGKDNSIYPEGVKEGTERALDTHTTTERHHPEVFDSPTDMTDSDIVEMVADWHAMSQELGGSTKDWADQNVGNINDSKNKHWAFSDSQVDLIYNIINVLESFEGEKTMEKELVGKKADLIPGGLADNIEDEEFDPEQIAKGIQVELEHTDDIEMAKEIAKDHLKEIPDYYDRLESMEEAAKMDKKNRVGQFNPEKAEIIEVKDNMDWYDKDWYADADRGWYIRDEDGEIFEGPFETEEEAKQALKDFQAVEYKESNKIGRSKTAAQVVEQIKSINNSFSFDMDKAVDNDMVSLERMYIQYIRQGNTYFPTGEVKLVEKLGSYPYEAKMGMSGVEFERVKPLTDELLIFANSPMNEVVKEVDKFWNSKQAYDNLGLTHNRGILLFGPPGTGKSICLQQTADLMSKRGDVVFFVKNATAMLEGLKAFRQVEPDRKVVIAFEEADELCQYNERDVLRIMDGDAKIGGVLFLATTNYIDKLSERMLRPGRFDHKVYVGYPSYENRLHYLKQKLSKVETNEKRLVELAEKTDGLGFGHLRELITGIYAIGDTDEQVFEKLNFKIASLKKKADLDIKEGDKVIVTNVEAETPEEINVRDEGWVAKVKGEGEEKEFLVQFPGAIEAWFPHTHVQKKALKSQEHPKSFSVILVEEAGYYKGGNVRDLKSFSNNVSEAKKYYTYNAAKDDLEKIRTYYWEKGYTNDMSIIKNPEMEDEKILFETSPSGDIRYISKKKTSGIVTLESGQFGWDYILRSDDGQEVLIQTDWDYPGVARNLGWTGEDNKIAEAQEFLDGHIGESFEDPGYFEMEGSKKTFDAIIPEHYSDYYIVDAKNKIILDGPFEGKDFTEKDFKAAIFDTGAKREDVKEMLGKDVKDWETFNPDSYKGSKKSYKTKETDLRFEDFWGMIGSEVSVEEAEKLYQDYLNYESDALEAGEHIENWLVSRLPEKFARREIKMLEMNKDKKRKGKEAIRKLAEKIQIKKADIRSEEDTKLLEKLEVGDRVRTRDGQGWVYEIDLEFGIVVVELGKGDIRAYEPKDIALLAYKKADRQSVNEKWFQRPYIEMDMYERARELVREGEGPDVKTIMLWVGLGDRESDMIIKRGPKRTRLSMNRISVTMQDGEAWVRRFLPKDEYKYDSIVRDILSGVENSEEKAQKIRGRVLELIAEQEPQIQNVDYDKVIVDMTEIDRVIRDYDDINFPDIVGKKATSEDKWGDKESARETERGPKVIVTLRGNFPATGIDAPHMGLMQGLAADLGGAVVGGDVSPKEIIREFRFVEDNKAREFVELVKSEYKKFNPEVSIEFRKVPLEEYVGNKKAMSEGDVRYVVQLAKERAEEREIEVDEALKEIANEYARGMRNHIQADPDEIYQEASEMLQREASKKFADFRLGDIVKDRTSGKEFKIIEIEIDEDNGSAVVSYERADGDGDTIEGDLFVQKFELARGKEEKRKAITIGNKKGFDERDVMIASVVSEIRARAKEQAKHFNYDLDEALDDVLSDTMDDWILSLSEAGFDVSGDEIEKLVRDSSYISKNIVKGKKADWWSDLTRGVDVPSSEFVSKKEGLERRIMELSQKFLDLSDMFKEATDLSKTIKDIIYTIASARTGIVMEMDDIRQQYEQLKRGCSVKTADDLGLEDLGRDIEDLVMEWQDLDEEMKEKERELYELEYDKNSVMDEMSDLGRELQEAKEEFNLDTGLFYSQPSGWFAKLLMSKVDSEGISKVSQDSLEEFKQWLSTMDEKEVALLIDRKAKEIQDVINKIKLAENKINELKKDHKEKLSFMDKMLSALGKETAETTKWLVKMTKWAQRKKTNWQQVALWIMDRIDDDLRKQADEYIKSLEELEERIKVTVTPKKKSNFTEVDDGFFVYAFIEDKDKEGWTRERIWDQAVKRFSNNIDAEEIQSIVEGFYSNKRAEGAWDTIKGFVKGLWDNGVILLSSLRKWNKELEDLFYEGEEDIA